MRRFPILAAVVLFGLGPAVAPAQDVPKEKEKAQDKPAEKVEGDLAKLQGKWKAMVGPQKNIPLVVDFKGKALSATLTSPQGEDFVMTGEIKLDEKASPKAVDWLHFKTPNGDEAEPNYGVYRFEGETWVVCNGGPGNPRPAGFKPGEGGPPNLIEFERQKE